MSGPASLDLPEESRRFLIVDGHAYAYRAFHAIRSLNSPDGRPTNAIYGFIKMLGKMREAAPASLLTVVWDGGLAEERTTLLPAYKAQRPPMPDALDEQIAGLKEYLDAAGLRSLEHDGVEADDWIATLAHTAAEAGMPVVIASSDKDFMQLVSERIGLLNPSDKSEAVWTAEQVRAKTGVAPGAVVDWLSLIGDAVDNIPGVPGVGPKTATELLNRFGTVDALYARLDEVASERLRAALRGAGADVRRNQRLIRLRRDLDLEPAWDACAAGAPSVEALRSLYRRWGFKSMLAALESPGARQEVLL
jgi:DNA polymerase-1